MMVGAKYSLCEALDPLGFKACFVYFEVERNCTYKKTVAKG